MNRLFGAPREVALVDIGPKRVERRSDFGECFTRQHDGAILNAWSNARVTCAALANRPMSPLDELLSLGDRDTDPRW
jgi:hypothetical protein